MTGIGASDPLFAACATMARGIQDLSQALLRIGAGAYASLEKTFRALGLTAHRRAIRLGECFRPRTIDRVRWLPGGAPTQKLPYGGQS